MLLVLKLDRLLGVEAVFRPDQVIELALNISDAEGPAPIGEVLLCSNKCGDTVPAHGWAIGLRPRTDEDEPFLVRGLG